MEKNRHFFVENTTQLKTHSNILKVVGGGGDDKKWTSFYIVGAVEGKFFTKEGSKQFLAEKGWFVYRGGLAGRATGRSPGGPSQYYNNFS